MYGNCSLTEVPLHLVLSFSSALKTGAAFSFFPLHRDTFTSGCPHRAGPTHCTLHKTSAERPGSDWEKTEKKEEGRGRKELREDEP